VIDFFIFLRFSPHFKLYMYQQSWLISVELSFGKKPAPGNYSMSIFFSVDEVIFIIVSQIEIKDGD